MNHNLMLFRFPEIVSLDIKARNIYYYIIFFCATLGIYCVALGPEVFSSGGTEKQKTP